MDTTVKIRDVRPGNIIIEDIFVNTIYPIIRKNTVITPEHVEVLHVFDIKEVKIQQRMQKKEEVSDGKVVNAEELLAELALEKELIQDKYNDAVKEYKREFSSWRAGSKVDVAKVRSIMLPVIETFSAEKKLLTLLNEFSNARDYLYHHSVAVGILAAAISKEMGFSVGQVLQMGIAGVLADCGMSKIDPTITEKAAFLTREEFNEVKKHTIYSYQMVKDATLIRQEMKIAIVQHHERLDGSGYPRGDKLENITVFSQILAVADVYHAMTSERVYRAKESPFKVIEMLMEEEFGKFNIEVIQALRKLVGRLTIGTKVKLTNGKTGTVVFVNRNARLRPAIRLHEDASAIMDLATNRDVAVESIIN